MSPSSAHFISRTKAEYTEFCVLHACSSLSAVDLEQRLFDPQKLDLVLSFSVCVKSEIWMPCSESIISIIETNNFSCFLYMYSPANINKGIAFQEKPRLSRNKTLKLNIFNYHSTNLRIRETNSLWQREEQMNIVAIAACLLRLLPTKKDEEKPGTPEQEEERKPPRVLAQERGASGPDARPSISEVPLTGQQ